MTKPTGNVTEMFACPYAPCTYQNESPYLTKNHIKRCRFAKQGKEEDSHKMVASLYGIPEAMPVQTMAPQTSEESNDAMLVSLPEEEDKTAIPDIIREVCAILENIASSGCSKEVKSLLSKLGDPRFDKKSSLELFRASEMSVQ